MRTNDVAENSNAGVRGRIWKNRAARNRRRERLRANARSCRGGTAAPNDEMGQNAKHHAGHIEGTWNAVNILGRQYCEHATGGKMLTTFSVVPSSWHFARRACRAVVLLHVRGSWPM
jgi:hypothetical protein